jgi:3-deoxy-manno-octulosonate cytidylyltransferase (CMP-KDO synthetase)
MATLSVPIVDEEEAFNPNAVKVVTDKDGYALYFSRACIPWDRDRFAASDLAAGRHEQIGDHYQRHIGIYAYRAGFIQRYVDWAPSALEQVEALEQLRVLWYGEKIHVAQALQAPPVGVDTQADLDKVRALLAN